MADYPKGTVVRCSIEFTEVDGGVNIDPTTVKFYLIKPSGSETVYEYDVDSQLVRDDTGQYHVDVTTDESGKWYFRFVGTGTNAAADDSTFYVEHTLASG